MSYEQKLRCAVCGRVITKEDNDRYDRMWWKCWDDQLTEESDSLFDDLM